MSIFAIIGLTILGIIMVVLVCMIVCIPVEEDERELIPEAGAFVYR